MTRQVKSKRLKVISVCSECGEPVMATKFDRAYRHGYKRYRTQMNQAPNSFKRFSQEDGGACKGSGKTVVYKRRTK